MSQYVYLALWSETTTAAEMTADLGVAPDKVMVRGSKRASPPVPIGHAWKLECRDRGLSLDEQIERVLIRVTPVASKVRSLVDSGDVKAVLQVVRYFNDHDGEEEAFEASITPEGELLERIPGQHQLLGWHLPTSTIQLLASMSAELDADEYG
jgi:hypothetical protein